MIRNKVVSVLAPTGIPATQVPDQYGGRGIGIRKIPQWWFDVHGDINIDDPGNVNGYTYRINGIPVLFGGDGVPAGANGQIQFNSNGVLGASPNFVWDNINNILDLTSSLELITTGGQNNIFSVAVDGQGNPLTTMKSSTATAYLIIDQGQPGGGGGIIFNTNGVYNGEISSWTAGGFQLFAPNRQQAIAVTATGNVGIGGVTNLPAAALNSPVTVVANMSTTGSALHINRYTNDTIAPGLYSYKARGTTSAPTPILSGDWLGFLGWGGLLSSATAVDGAEINIITTTVTATGIAADVQFTVNDGTTANGTERLRLTHDGRVLITGTLWVNGVQVTVP